MKDKPMILSGEKAAKYMLDKYGELEYREIEVEMKGKRITKYGCRLISPDRHSEEFAGGIKMKILISEN